MKHVAIAALFLVSLTACTKDIKVERDDSLDTGSNENISKTTINREIFPRVLESGIQK